MDTRYPIKTVLLSGENFEILRLLNEDSTLSLEFNGDNTACLMALYQRWQQEEKVSFKLALKSGVSGEKLREMQAFEAIPEDQQLSSLLSALGKTDESK